MAIDGRLNFDTKIDTKGFTKGVSSINSQLTSMKNILLKVSTALGMAFGFKETLEASATVNAANAQMAQTFGNLQAAAKGAMQSVADSSSILQTRLQTVGTTIYAFAKTTGMDSVSALNLMNDALQITADSAAYYDRSLESTAESLRSFLKGNFENDAALGLSCTETTRNAAANKLYGKSYIELSEAQKQLTLLQMVKDANALSGAEGQAAREADSWENVIGNLKESWRQLLAVVGQPILAASVTVVQNLTSMLQRLTGSATAAVNALSKVFDIQLMDDQSKIADSAQTAADNYEDMADSAADAQKSTEASLAGFDQINKLGDDKSSDNALGATATATGTKLTTSVDADVTPASKRFEELFKTIKQHFNTVFDPLKQAWNSKGIKVTDSIRFAFDGIWSVIKSVGTSFGSVWSNGTGLSISQHLLDIWSNINNTIGYASGNFAAAWSDGSGTQIVQDVLNIFDDLLDTIDNITADTAAWAKNIDFTPLIESVANITSALEPLTGNIFDGLEWLWDNILLPFAGWTITDAIPAFFNALSDVLSGLNSVWEAAEPALQRLWDNFLQPLAKWAAKATVSIVQNLAGAFKTMCGNVTEKDIDNLMRLTAGIGAIIAVSKGKQAIDNISQSLAGLKGSITSGLSALNEPATASLGTVALAIQAAIAGWTIGSWIYDTFGDDIDSVMYPIYDAFVVGWNAIAEFFTITVPVFFSGIWQGIKDVFSAVGDWFTEVFQAAWDGIVSVWIAVTGWFSDLWKSIKGVFSAVSIWFKSIFTKAWEGVKSAWANVVIWFSAICQGIKNTFSVVAAWFRDIFSKAWESIKSAWSNVIAWFSNLWLSITSVFFSAGSWFGNIFANAWAAIKTAFSSTAAFFRNLWTAIKSPFVKVADWFKSIFSKAWEAVKNVFSAGGKIFDGIKDGISGVFTSVVNKLIDGINVIITKPLEFLNGVLNDIRDIEIAGFTPFDEFWGYDPIPVPQIPKLAQGAVIPPNSEFLAILGDQQHGTNIEAPLDTIRQAVLQALAAYGGTGNQKVSVTIPLTLNGRTITQIVVDDINDYIRRNGKSPLKA